MAHIHIPYHNPKVQILFLVPSHTTTHHPHLLHHPHLPLMVTRPLLLLPPHLPLMATQPRTLLLLLPQTTPCMIGLSVIFSPLMKVVYLTGQYLSDLLTYLSCTDLVLHNHHLIVILHLHPSHLI